MFDRKRSRHTQTPPIRQWMLLGLVVLQSVAVVLLLLTARSNTSALQLENAGTVMNHLSENVLERSQRFLAPAEQSVTLMHGLIGRNRTNPRSREFDTLLLEQVANVPQLTGMYFGGTDGYFSFARRETEGYSLKKIVKVGNKTTTSITLYDLELNLVSSQVVKNDGFDPRSRPWFRSALERNALIWTGPYIFFSSQHPGITTALPTRDQNGNIVGVVGVDIEITVLSEFIAKIPTSPNGAAYIATKSGEVVAMPNLSNKVAAQSRSLPKLEEVGNAPAQALATLGQQDHLTRFEVGNQGYVGMLRPLLVNQDADWRLGLFAPKSDFVGSTESIFNRQLWQTIAIGCVVLLGAIALIWRVSSPIEIWYKRATTDELTQLLNRSEFIVQAKKTLQHATSPSVLVMFDLDRFKTVNDVFGHDAGDKVLSTIAQRLRYRVRAYDLTARFGGDEFAILLPNISLETANARLEEWRKEIVEPFRQMVSVSVGMTAIHRADDLEHKIIEADHALLQAKQAGKDQVLSTAG
jgi:diguanylate cyclase (GGDEF)-like protein